MVRQALASARKNRSSREILPLRVFDPACGSGTVLLAVYHNLLDNAGGSSLTFEERREILTHSVHGLDINRHAVAVTRMLLFLELCDCPGTQSRIRGLSPVLHNQCSGISGTPFSAVMRLSGRRLSSDESWMFCPARDRHTLNPFSVQRTVPGNCCSGRFRSRRQQPPGRSRLNSASGSSSISSGSIPSITPSLTGLRIFLEKSLSLFPRGGIVSCVMSDRWLHGSAGSPLREAARHPADRGDCRSLTVPAGNPGAGLCLLRVVLPPRHGIFAGSAGRCRVSKDPDAYVAAHRFPVDQRTSG